VGFLKRKIKGWRRKNQKVWISQFNCYLQKTAVLNRVLIFLFVMKYYISQWDAWDNTCFALLSSCEGFFSGGWIILRLQSLKVAFSVRSGETTWAISVNLVWFDYCKHLKVCKFCKKSWFVMGVIILITTVYIWNKCCCSVVLSIHQRILKKMITVSVK